MDNRIQNIKNNTSTNEAQEIVNANLNKRLSDVEGIIDIDGTGTRISINEEKNYIPKIIFNGTHFTNTDYTVTIINCGSAEGMGGS